jgi:hypothetical protein
MAQIHRLPDVSRNERRLVDMTWGELRALIAEMISTSRPPDEKPLKPTEFGELMGVAEKRVQEWCEQGMPYMPTGDVRGKRIRPSKAMAWLEENHG